MKVLLFGATGMVGQGVLRECLLDPDVERVLSIVRTSSGTVHEKLVERVHGDFFEWRALESELTGWDACNRDLNALAVEVQPVHAHA